MSHTDETPLEPLALFGGTFDPVHFGHLRCADEVRQKLNLKELYLLPAGTPVHRQTPQATVGQRLEMLQLAQLDFPGLLIDDREIRRTGPSYMVDTLHELRAEYPQRSLILIIGQDATNLLHTWFKWEQLFALAHIVILTRPGSRLEYQELVASRINRHLSSEIQDLRNSTAGTVLNLDVTALDISSTRIKSLIRRGQAPHSMLPASVLNYINKNHLYVAD
jgi:nicotinate-nucleotide adenylyltransferase